MTLGERAKKLSHRQIAADILNRVRVSGFSAAETLRSIELVEQALREVVAEALETKMKMIRCSGPEDILVVDNRNTAEMISANYKSTCKHFHLIVVGEAEFKARGAGK